ncbi:MAG: VOC family protein [Deltaproteobacteria bacterium]|nr:VOC family protein [Deltaproteobacteria bacterium]
METTNHVLDAVLDELSLPHIEERLSRDFFYQLGLRFPQQYGIACRDVTSCVQRAEALGAGPFLHTTVSAPNWIENGELVPDCKLEFALGYAGDIQIELLGPGQGTEHYARAIRDTDIAFHHVGIYQRGMEQLAASITGAGYPQVVQGGIALGNANSTWNPSSAPTPS